LTDTDAVKRSLEEVRRARDYANAIVETVREPLVVLDSSLRVVTANHSFYATFRLSSEEIEKRSIFELSDVPWSESGLRKLLEQILPANTHFNDFKLTHVFPRVGRRTLVLNARKLLSEGESPAMILLAMEDITDWESTTAALEASRERLRDLTAGLLTAQEEERRRISRELHDDLNQRLGMLSVELETLERKPPKSAELAGRQLASIRSRIVDISEDLRRTAHQLHPSFVDHLGLPAALRSLCMELSKQEKMRIDYRQGNMDVPIPSDIALCLYRVAQEALRNVAQHSNARRATVSLTRSKQSVALSIRDAGSGFDTASKGARKGLGIVSMEERVRLVNGSLTIRSKPGGGTRVVADAPLSRGPEGPAAPRRKGDS
jgi:PAS domain S-box-containing protein